MTPGLTYYEPAVAYGLALIMGHAFRHLQADDGGSVYLCLTTRAIAQVARVYSTWEADALRGGYWLRRPRARSGAALVFTGAIVTEVLAAFDDLAGDIPRLGVLMSPCPIYFTAAGRQRRPRGGPARARRRAVSKRCWRHLQPTHASSPSSTGYRRRCRGLAAYAAAASLRLVSIVSARPGH